MLRLTKGNALCLWQLQVYSFILIYHTGDKYSIASSYATNLSNGIHHFINLGQFKNFHKC